MFDEIINLSINNFLSKHNSLKIIVMVKNCFVSIYGKVCNCLTRVVKYCSILFSLIGEIMKKIFALLGVFLLSFCFVLTGCGSLGSMPASDAIIVGNGGFVAQKGEYIYFANAYTSYSSLSTIDNRKGKVVEYALNRVKVKDIQTKEIEFDEEGYAKNVETVVSKVVGFENSNFYIVGDFLYFASPNIHKNSSNENMFDLISIFRVKLDGSGLKELYTTQSSTNGDFAIYNLNGKNYLITVEGNFIYKQELTNKGLANKTQLCDDVVSTILVDEIKFENDAKLYYTASRSESDTEIGLTGNVLKYVDLVTGKVEVVSNVIGETITIISRNNGVMFYSKKNLTEDTYYWIKDFSTPDRKVTNWTGITNFFYMGKDSLNQTMPMVYNYQSKLVMQTISSFEVEVLVDENVTPIMTDGEYVYYTNSSGFYRISYKDKVATKICEVSDYQSTFDFDGRYLYYFEKTPNNTSDVKYLYRLDIYQLEQQNSVEPQLLSKVLEKDKKTD